MKIRQDFGIRVAGEKARYEDEFITRGQVIAGDNIYLEWTNEENLKINANVTVDNVGTEGESIVAIVGIDQYAPNSESLGNLSKNSSGGVASASPRYHTATYVDIHHNFNLTSAEILVNITPYSDGKHQDNEAVTKKNSMMSFVKAIHLTPNILRLRASAPVAVHRPAAWNKSVDKLYFRSDFENAYDLSSGPDIPDLKDEMLSDTLLTRYRVVIKRNVNSKNTNS